MGGRGPQKKDAGMLDPLVSCRVGMLVQRTWERGWHIFKRPMGWKGELAT